MDKLWAPWRAKYVTQLIHNNKECVFCRIDKEKKDNENYVFIRTKHSFAVLNIYPYNNGHSLIVPYRHVADLSKLKRGEKQDLFEVLEVTKSRLDKALKPEGYNIGINIGRVAGAGFPEHVHIHIVPRWGGDVNFMPVIGKTKVISQSLDVLFKRLKGASTKKG
jgi:ATP adenylyltransferase